MVRARTFRSHYGLCGQPAGLGRVARFRPLPSHAGHLTRINATPSDLPLMSTGFATYPLPPHFGQLSGAIAPPHVAGFSTTFCWKLRQTGSRYESRTKLWPTNANRYRLNRARSQSKASLTPGLPNHATAETLAFVKTIRHQSFCKFCSFVEHVTRIMGNRSRRR